MYVENVTAGEDVRIADRSLRSELEALKEDFAIFDAETDDASVVLFDYDTGGRVQGYRVASDRESVDRCREQYDLALARSVGMRTPHPNYPWPQSGGAIGISFAVTYTGPI